MERTNGHPLWAILDHQGRTLAWLARVTEYSESHIWAMKGGRAEPTARFRARCAAALGLPEWALFEPEGAGQRDGTSTVAVAS